MKGAFVELPSDLLQILEEHDQHPHIRDKVLTHNIHLSIWMQDSYHAAVKCTAMWPLLKAFSFLSFLPWPAFLRVRSDNPFSEVLWSHEVHRYSRSGVTIYTMYFSTTIKKKSVLRLDHVQESSWGSAMLNVVYSGIWGEMAALLWMRQSLNNRTEHFWINYYCM